MRTTAMKNPSAFTLIELLVVVAIIAILAAIATVNFLGAQTRSKVARVVADMRTLAGGVEAYTVDHGLPPLDWNVGRGDPQYPEMEADTSGILHPGRANGSGVGAGLTTPIAYVTNCWMDDPFSTRSNRFDERKYTYNWFGPNPNRGVEPNPEYVFQEYDVHYGFWRLLSIGPDGSFFNGGQGLFQASIVYDPTNGTASNGNILRSQREGEVTARPPMDVLLEP